MPQAGGCGTVPVMTGPPASALAATALDDVEARTSYAAPRQVDGVRWSRRVSPDDYSIWMAISELEDGATLQWDDEHGDDGVYVMSGALEVNGALCPEDGAVIVESGAACTARAVGVTTVVHCGAHDVTPPGDGIYGTPEPGGHGVHVIGDGGWYASGNRGARRGPLVR